MKKRTTLWLGTAIAFQLLVLLGMHGFAALPIWFGEEIRVKTIPVDPRSLFRGNYARLRYDFSRIEGSIIPTGEKLRRGTTIYAILTPGEGDIYEFTGTSLEKPTQGKFLRGRITRSYVSRSMVRYDVDYGIDAFFAPKKRAEALERKLWKSGIAVLMVTEGGVAALVDVIAPDDGSEKP